MRKFLIIPNLSIRPGLNNQKEEGGDKALSDYLQQIISDQIVVD